MSFLPTQWWTIERERFAFLWHPSPRHFLLGFLVVLLSGTLLFAAGLALLDRLGMLPPPPFTATACIDEKFAFLAQRDLRDVDFLAIGSSVTWRNLDMEAFRRHGLARRPLNAAPCYVNISQTAFLADFLLERMPSVETVVSVVAPRDFEECAAPREAFFSVPLAAAYIFHGMPALPIYFANFQPHKFVRDVFRIKAMRSDPGGNLSLLMDDYGSGPLRATKTWLPAPDLSEACFAALGELERVVSRHGARLLVAAFPLQAQWRQRFDPDGAFIAAFEARIADSLQLESSRFISGRQAIFRTLHHADAVHYVWDSAVAYSERLAQQAARAAAR